MITLLGRMDVPIVTDLVAWSVGWSVSHAVSSAKTAEPIDVYLCNYRCLARQVVQTGDAGIIFYAGLVIIAC